MTNYAAGYSEACNRNPGLWAYGFHTSDNDLVEVINGRENAHIWVNLTNILSWVPILSTISGIYHLHRASKIEKALGVENDTLVKNVNPLHKAYASALRKRAYAEFAQIGFLFFICVDITVSLLRMSYKG
jgi:hypothetical protein